MDILQLLSRKRVQGLLVQLIGAIFGVCGWQFDRAAWAEIVGIVLLIAGYVWHIYGAAKAEQPLTLRQPAPSTGASRHDHFRSQMHGTGGMGGKQ